MIEKRTHPRVPLGVPVTVLRADGTSFSGTAKDISIGGMFIVTGQQPEFGTELSISFNLPNAKQELVLPATVRWSVKNGFGVQFGLVGARETHALTEFIASDRNRHS